MGNRSGMERVGRGHPGQPPGLVDAKERDDGDDAASSPFEAGGGRDSAWERMLEALGEDDGPEVNEESLDGLRASIAERLHTREGTPADRQVPIGARRRSARRRRR